MATVRIEQRALWVDDIRVPLISGEVHYWRLSPARWDAVLASARSLGLHMIATYVPWHFHELAPGRFDFAGHTDPQRNLVGFLDKLTEADFWVIIRPGPYIYAEWTNAGVPDRIVNLPRLSDAYRQEAEVWLHAVVDVLRPHLATRGGRVVLVQPDNEMDLFSHWFEDAAGLSGTRPGFFQQFAGETYGDVAALNAAWGTDFTDFTAAHPHAERLNQHEPGMLIRQKDYWRFQHWATAEGIRWHADQLRALGIDVPLVANYYPGGDVQNWRDVARHVDCVGIDWYPRNEFAGDPHAQRVFLDTCRYQRLVSPLPHIAEFEAGVWHGFHDYVGALSPNHYRLTTCSALLAGIAGFNWYMLANRDNWYYSPINERGDLRPELAGVFRDIHRIVDAIDPTTLAKQTDVSVLLDPLHIATERALRDNPVLDALHAADIDFEFYDPQFDAIRKPVTIYSGVDWLAPASQRRLLEYVEAGGQLVLLQNWPQRDDLFQPCNLLGIAPPDRILSRLGKRVEVELGGQRAEVEGPVWEWDNPPGEPITGVQVAGRQQAVENADRWMTAYIGRRWTCGYRQSLGKGTLVMLGLQPNADLLRAVLHWLGARLFAQAEHAAVRTAIATRDDHAYLFGTNLADGDVQTRVTLDGLALTDRTRCKDLQTGRPADRLVDGFLIDLPRRSGGIWHIGPRE